MKKIIALALIICIAFSMTGCFALLGLLSDEDEPASSTSSASPYQVLFGEWATEKGTLFTMYEDGTCGWYKNKDDRTDFYYTGEQTAIKTGQEALDELGISIEEQLKSDFYKDGSKIYSVKFYYNYLFSEGADKSDTLEKDGYQWIMFKIVDDTHAVALNVNTITHYELEKIA